MLVALSASNQASLLTCAVNPLNATGGTATFAGCKINLAGMYTLMAIDVADGLQAKSAPLDDLRRFTGEARVRAAAGRVLRCHTRHVVNGQPTPSGRRGRWRERRHRGIEHDRLDPESERERRHLEWEHLHECGAHRSGEAAFTNCTIGAFGENFTVTATGTGGFSGSTISQPFSIAGLRPIPLT